MAGGSLIVNLYFSEIKVNLVHVACNTGFPGQDDRLQGLQPEAL